MRKSHLEKIFSENFGKDKYKSARGGGTPAGEEDAFGDGIKVNPAGKGREGWHKAGQPGKREENQPRDAEGHFTYNSVIGKPLKDISKVHGKSRGKTVPPILNGGKNGEKFVAEDEYYIGKDGKRHLLKRHFELDEEAIKKWEGVWFSERGEIASNGKIKIAPEDLFSIVQEWVVGKISNRPVAWDKKETGKEYVSGKGDNLTTKKHISKVLVYADTGEEVDFSKLRGDFGHGNIGQQVSGEAKITGNINKWETKKGKKVEEEKQAIKEARKSKEGFATVKAKGEDKADIKEQKVFGKTRAEKEYKGAGLENADNPELVKNTERIINDFVDVDRKEYERLTKGKNGGEIMEAVQTAINNVFPGLEFDEEDAIEQGFFAEPEFQKEFAKALYKLLK